MTLKNQLKELETRIMGLERKLDAVLNILVSDIYEEEFHEPSIIEMGNINDGLIKLN